ncbi:GAF domain-containing protein [Streptomyces sp. NPDC045456]|uniref:GAF domain-containing protein n=1 Tax=Streptomyces sp. NPDC045456 TaxID=3155254 RepID=UPI0033E7DFC0
MASKGDLAAVLGDLRASSGGEELIGVDAVRCAQVLGVDGVAVSVPVTGELGELVWSTAGTSARLEDLQYTLGQGPALEAAVMCAPVAEPDLAHVAAGRWPALLPEAIELGVGAVFCFPLLLGGACLGTLTLQRTAPGPLRETERADAWLVAGALTAVLADGGQQWAVADPRDDSVLYRAAVHQAAGMVSVQAKTTLAQALMRLRAYAFARGRTVVEVAEDVVARRVHFRNDQDGPGASDR